MRTACLIVFVLSVSHSAVATPLLAQTGSMRVTMPSPTAASLGRFGEVPVNLYTGAPDVTIPLFTVKGRTLELPLTLKYHASGIRVEEVGGWAGLGWTLEAGGAIVRTVRGLVDELGNGYYNTGNTFYNASNWPNPSGAVILNIANNTLDGEPDRFFFSFAGRSGQFVMGPTTTSGSIKEYRSIPYQKLKIDPAITGAGITAWTITAEDGTRYTFGAAETTVDFSTPTPGSVIPANFGDTYKSAWHLTGIRAPGGDSISLHYSTYVVRHRPGNYREKFDQIYAQCVPNQFDVTAEYETTVQRLDSIKAAAHTIRFTTALRSDAVSPTGTQQEHRLDRISIRTPSGTEIRRFQFEHDYYPGNRLRLKNVYEQDRNGISLPPYTFTYEGQTLPARTSFAIDHWGYYNGKTSNTTPIPAMLGMGGIPLAGGDRRPDPTFMKAGVLTRVAYPTGGYAEFVYESNDYGAIGSGGTTPLDFGPIQTQSVSSSGFQGPQTTPFTVVGSQAVIATVTVTLDPSCQMIGCPLAEIVGKETWNQSGTYSVALSPGSYTLLASDEWSGGFASIQVEWRDYGPAKKKTAGGLRIGELRTADGMGGITIRKYKYTTQADTAKSSGVISVEPSYGYSYTSPTCTYFSRSATSKMPLGEGPPVGYSEVVVFHGADGEYGRTLHRFRSVLNVGDDTPPGSTWPFSTRTSHEWKRGQEIGTTEWNSAGQTQRGVSAGHRFRDEGTPDTTTTRRFRGISVNTFSGGIMGSTYSFHPFEVISAWAFQEADTTFIYNESGSSSFSAIRTFAYSNANHVQPTQLTETNSNGTQRITRMKYPADYASGATNSEATAITAMKGSAHMHSPVIERWVSDKVGTTERVVRAEISSFKSYASSQYLPYQRFVFNSTTPVTNFVPSTVNGSFTKDSRYLLQETANTYDAFGRVTQLADARGKLANYQYGGNPNSALITKVTRVKDATGAIDLVTDLAYDSDQNVSSIKDEGGSFRYFTWDLYGRLRQIRNHAGLVTKGFGYTYSRTSGNDWTFEAGSPNAVLDTTYVQHSPSVVRVVTREHLDGLGRPVQTALQDGTSHYVTARQYDAMGRDWRSWKPYTRTTGAYDPSFAGHATDFYNMWHNVSDAKPYIESQYTTDALGRVKKVIPEFSGSSSTAFTTYTYGVDTGPMQRFTEIMDESGKKQRRYTDVFGNEVKTVLGSGAAEATTTSLAYDVLGQRTQISDPRGIGTGYALDTRGLLSTRTSQDRGNRSHKYDKAGNLRYTQDANQAAAGLVSFTNYDFANRPLNSGQGTATFSTLDPDAAGTPGLETSTSNWQVVRAYDAKPSSAAFPWSQFSTQIGPLTLNQVSGRLAGIATKSNGAWQIELFSYDPDGNVQTRYTFTQNHAGNSVWTALNTTVAHTRDLRNEITRRTITIGSNSFYQWYDYNGRGLLWKIFAATTQVKPGTADVTYTYLPGGEVQDRQFQGSLAVPFRYTLRGQLQRIGDPATTTYPFSARYAYHPNAAISEAEFYSAGSPAAHKRYRYLFGAASYDALNRLKSADYSHWNGSSWTSTLAYDLSGINYDAAGNLTTLRRYKETGALIDSLIYSYPSTSNRLSSITDLAGITPETWDTDGSAFTYDANGNLKNAQGPYWISGAEYDHHNLPLWVVSFGDTIRYRNNHEGHRLSRRIGSGDTKFHVVEGRTKLATLWVSPSGAPTSWWYNLVAGDRVVGRADAVTRLYYHADLLGSTRSVVRTDGSILESYDYDPWGLYMAGRMAVGGTNEQFAGGEWDGESVYYFGARSYLPAFGRWSTVDALADSFPNWNAYNYVINNPVVFADPFGLAPCPPDNDCGALTAALATTGAIIGGFGGGVFGGGVGLACGPGAPACSVAGASTFSAQGATLGAWAGLALGLVFSKSHTVGTVEIQGRQVRVDWNEPRGKRLGDVHVQSKGGKPLYEKLSSPDDLARLPRPIRENETVQQLVQKAFDLLGRFKQ